MEFVTSVDVAPGPDLEQAVRDSVQSQLAADGNATDAHKQAVNDAVAAVRALAATGQFGSAALLTVNVSGHFSADGRAVLGEPNDWLSVSVSVREYVQPEGVGAPVVADDATPVDSAETPAPVSDENPGGAAAPESFV